MQTPTSDGRTKAELNVTPMIDILLVLIIIFMVIAPIASRGLPAILPQKPPQDEPHPQPARREIVVCVHRDGSLELNQEAIDLPGLERRLAVIFRNSSNPVIFVRGDRDIEFKRVAEVVDAARGVGVRGIGLMTN